MKNMSRNMIAVACAAYMVFIASIFAFANSPHTKPSQTFADPANKAQTPLNDGSLHLGGSSCYGSTCHSRQAATGITVRQNEMQTWQDETSPSGAHYRAYQTLLTERSKRIAKRLNLATPAHQAKECLSCHADGIAPKRQGPKFHMDDGVGCESCHGGAGASIGLKTSTETWLSQHYQSGADHSKNLSLGLYALENAETRADVCLSCHVGSADQGQFVTHRLMAAGHPRMSFELDLFTALQSHHNEDVDYKARKNAQTGVQIWAIGQVKMLQRQLSLFANPNLNRDGIFPELVFFDCLACHRTISDDPDWIPRVNANPGRPSAPGIVKFNDANMIMVLALARHIAPDQAPILDQNIKNLHKAIGGQGEVDTAMSAVQTNAQTILEHAKTADFTKPVIVDLLDTIVTDTLRRRYTDYVAAEQAVMAIDTLLSSMIASKQIAAADVKSMRREINQAYSAVENANTYDQKSLTAALTSIHSRLKEL